TLAEFIIGSIDDNGYLTRDVQAITDDVQIRGNLPVNENDVRRLLDQVKQFEPAGVAALDLRECLLLQLQRKPLDDINRHAQIILKHHFDEFSRKQYDKLQRSLNINESELRDVIHLITHLNPKPGAVFTDGPSAGAQTVMADFTVVQEGGQLDLQIHGRNAPELRVSNTYRTMLETYTHGAEQSRSQREALQFVKQKIESAKWFIDAIEQRRNTLLQTMRQILRLQEAFFLSGDEAKLKPMILKDVADATGLDISTISRVVNSKYVQTEYGLFKLKFFFSEGMANKEGEEVSTREVKTLLAELIQTEDKRHPLTDDQLTERLSGLGSEKWAVHIAGRRRADAGRAMIFLSIGEPDSPPPAAILEEAARQMQAGRIRYAEGRGEANVRRALAAVYTRQTGRTINDDQFIYLPGTQTALFAAMMTVVDEGDEVLMADPYYATYEGVIAAAGGIPAPIRVDPDHGFHLRAEDLERAITPRSRVLLLNSPANPTGAVLTRAEIEKIGAVCERHDLWIVSDEVYATMTYGNAVFASPFDVPALEKRTIVV
ncbi:MAG: RNA polymerase factor sigma-54, partial [Chitinophagaceae bacterium]|nr:RNA polymerase factor sigma-54 [Chitinophagaceae bacterium]